MKYEFIDDIMSDVHFKAYGKDAKELFENAAVAMFTVICKEGQVKAKDKVEFEVKGKNLQDLLYNWLEHLIALVDIEEMFFSKFNILEITETSIKAEAYGESTKPELGETVVKAVTNYLFDLKKTNQGYIASISLDI